MQPERAARSNGGRKNERSFRLENVRFGRVTTAQRLGVAGVVFGAGEDAFGVVEALALVAADHRGAELTDQERILAERFADAAPAQITRQAEHGRERPMRAGGRHFAGGDARARLDGIDAPGASLTELRREDSRARVKGMPVNAVLADEERDAEARLGRDVHRGGEIVGEDVKQRARKAASSARC